jgi:isopentenyl-diphosphate Delta-isomerase
MALPDDIIAIVDAEDNVIGAKKASELDKAKDIYRVSSIWITNDKDELLMAQRAFTKRIYPGAWDVGVAGTIEKDETYDQNAKKEAFEELGITEPLVKGPKVRVEGEYNLFLQWYFLKLNKPVEDFVFQKDEIIAVKWFSKKELLEGIKKKPEQFLKNGKDMLRWVDMFWQ